MSAPAPAQYAKRAALAALFAFCAAFGGLAHAQGQASVARPDVKVGDRWLYQRSDYRVKPAVYLYELQVSFVDARAIHTVRRARRGEFLARHERTVRVLGWEDIDVPAGRFRTLKVEASGTWRRLDKDTSDWARNTFWYAPRVKRWVKYEYEDAYGKIGEELVFYVVQ